jgi:hypothetical protein
MTMMTVQTSEELTGKKVICFRCDKWKFCEVVTILLIGAAGCIPDSVVWLPDSSSFVYTDKQGSRLNCYDLMKGARKVIVENTSTKTCWPAVSPDGKRLAVAKIESSTAAGSDICTYRTQVIIYDLDGHQVAQSRVHESTERVGQVASNSTSTMEDAGLNWSGPANKILLEKAIYDCTKDEFVDINVMPWPTNNLPVAPNKKGFLAMTEKGLVFVDWDGWIKAFKDAPDMAKVEFVSFEWDGDVAKLVTSDGVHEYDVVRMMYTFNRRSPQVIQSDGKLYWIQSFANGGSNLSIFDSPDGTRGCRMEVQEVATGRRKVIVPQGQFECSKINFPSPNGKFFAVRWVSAQKHSAIIMVFDQQGSLLASISPED